MLKNVKDILFHTSTSLKEDPCRIHVGAFPPKEALTDAIQVHMLASRDYLLLKEQK